MATDNEVSADRRLLAAIAQKRRQLNQITREIRSLERQLASVRSFRLDRTPVPRSSSVIRLLVEHVVLDRLRSNVPPETSSDQLWPLAQTQGVRSRSTFRSHLRRMSERGLIVSLGNARWALAPGVSRERKISPEVRNAMKQIGMREGQGPRLAP